MEGLRKEFYDLYLNDLFPILERLEKVRVKNIQKLLLCEIGSAAGIILSGFFIYMIFHGNISDISIPGLTSDTLYFLLSVLAVAFMFAIYGLIGFMIWLPFSFAKKFKKKIKEKSLSRLKKLFGGIEWGKCDINDSIIQKSELFSLYNKLQFDDTFKSKADGVEFNVAETQLLYISRGYRGRQCTDVSFKGIMILLPSNKTIKAHTIVTTKGDFNIQNKMPLAVIIGILLYSIEPFMKGQIICGIICLIFSIIIVLVMIFPPRNKTQKIKTEDLNFDKRFSIQSQDQIEARYLVTPAFMDRLYNLKTAFGTNKIKCAFFYDKILFAISTQNDVFEIGSLFSSLVKGKTIERFFKELTSIYDIIDYFKLNEKTGL